MTINESARAAVLEIMSRALRKEFGTAADQPTHAPVRAQPFDGEHSKDEWLAAVRRAAGYYEELIQTRWGLDIRINADAISHEG